MARYLYFQIIQNRLTYAVVIKKFPRFKKTIDSYLAEDNCYIDEDGKCIVADNFVFHL